MIRTIRGWTPMNLKWIVTGVIVAGALTAILWEQRERSLSQRSKIESLERALDQRDDRVHELEASKERINRQRRELLSQTETQAVQLRKLTESGSSLAAAGGQAVADNSGRSEPKDEGFGKLLSKMMGDPQTRRFIREQQRLVMDQLYSPLVKQLGLDPETAARFKDTLVDQAMGAAEKASSLFGVQTNRAEAFAKLAADTKQQEAQLQELLGQDGFNQYKEYQTTVGERMQLNLFRQQLSSSNSGLSDQQSEQLLTLMKEEKETSRSLGQPVLGSTQDPAEMQAILSDDHTEQFILAQEGVNERVYERAKAFLSPDQLSAFASFQTNQLQMMRLGMGMARKLMSTD